MATPIMIGAAAGEYMESVTVSEWLFTVGDAIEAGDTIVVVETAKAATEIEAPRSGVLTKILAEAGEEVTLDVILGLVGDTPDDTAHDDIAHDKIAHDETRETSPSGNAGIAVAPVQASLISPSIPTVSPKKRIVASPLARKTAAARGINLGRVTASSPSGRIKLRDLDGIAPAPAPPLRPSAIALKDQPGPLAVFESGPADGIPVVLLHGFASDSQSWFPLERALSGTYRVIRMDLPNHGRSPKRRVADFAHLAREIRDMYDSLDLAGAHLIGHSLGGACALALADVRARTLASLTLMSPTGLGPTINEDFITGIVRASRPESLEPWLKQMVGDASLISRDFVLAAMESRADPELRAAQSQMVEDLFPDGVQGFDLTAALHRLELPASIIWGKQDRIISWKNALQAPGHVGLHFLKAVGHVPQLEAPDLVIRIIRSLIARSEV